MTTIKHSPPLPLPDLIPLIQAWGQKRGLHEDDDLKPQLVKLMEELGAVAAGVARDDDVLILGGIGDMLVVLVQFGAVYDKRYNPSLKPRTDFLTSCLNLAWDEIKDRKGKTENGMFIKEEDEEEYGRKPTNPNLDCPVCVQTQLRLGTDYLCETCVQQSRENTRVGLFPDAHIPSKLEEENIPEEMLRQRQAKAALISEIIKHSQQSAEVESELESMFATLFRKTQKTKRS